MPPRDHSGTPTLRRQARWSAPGAACEVERAGSAVHDPVGGVDDGGRRPVVLFESNDGRILVQARESEQVVGCRPGEGVDGLARVADHAHVVALAQPEATGSSCCSGDTSLVFVDHEEPVLCSRTCCATRGSDSIMPAVTSRTSLEVELLAVILDRLVGALQVDDLLDGEGRRQRSLLPAAYCSSVEPRNLAPLDLGRGVPQCRRIEFEPQRLGGVADHPPLALQQHGALPPTTCGQKNPSWDRADAWNVRAETPCRHRAAAGRDRNSPAARAVNVNAITRLGE